MGKQATDYKRTFNEQSYDRLAITVPKGHKEIIQAHAKQRKESINGFVNRAIVEAMQHDTSAE